MEYVFLTLFKMIKIICNQLKYINTEFMSLLKIVNLKKELAIKSWIKSKYNLDFNDWIVGESSSYLIFNNFSSLYIKEDKWKLSFIYNIITKRYKYV